MQQGWQQLERVDRSRPDIAEAREYRGLVLQPALDHEHDEVCRELWFVIHGATGNTVAVVAAGTNRAVQIASELAELKDWPAMQAWSWEDDEQVAALLAQHADAAELPRYWEERDDWDDVVPYGPN
jgi:hypothetical protein